MSTAADQGGLLYDAECGLGDTKLSLSLVREQLLRVERWLEEGKTEHAIIALGLLLRGTADDRLPTDAMTFR